MIIQLQQDITQSQTEEILDLLTDNAFQTKRVHTQIGNYIIAINGKEIDIRSIGNLEGVKDIHKVNDEYKLVSKKWKIEPTHIKLDNNLIIGEGCSTIIAGPCTIENENQIIETVDFLKKNNIRIMRGGVFKPRSSPYSFRGLGIEGLKVFFEICHASNIKIITEVMEPEQIEKMYDYVDIFQVGARNSQNFNLLEALGKIDKPVMIKRGLSGTINELLHSAEYIFSGGNEKIILCERGIRTFEKSYRNSFDINAIPLLKSKTHLPVFADPSHGTGIRELVEPISLAALIAGADGIMVEMHSNPNKAYSDGNQSITFNQASILIEKIKSLEKSLCYCN